MVRTLRGAKGQAQEVLSAYALYFKRGPDIRMLYEFKYVFYIFAGVFFSRDELRQAL
ncbi:MAG: hypothetical protein AB8G18_07615 [Gammaproteobacteria bacterium]